MQSITEQEGCSLTIAVPVEGKMKWMQSLREAGCLLPTAGLQIIWDRFLRINVGGFFRNVDHELVVLDSLGSNF